MAADPKPTAEPIFLGWGKDLASGVAEQLLDAFGKVDGVLDMGSHLVIVPAPMAGRLIEEALVAARPAGLLIPRFRTPADFLNQLDGDDGASEATALMTWIEVLGKADRTQLKSLFPISNSDALSHEELKQLAWTLMSVRDTLGETPGAHNMESVSALPENTEQDRWRNLAALEKAYVALLKLRGYADHNDRRRTAASAPKAPAGITHIWLACVTEPQPIIVTALGHLAAQGIHVRAIVGAAGERGAFDAWGRPQPAYWLNRKPDWSDFNERVHSAGNTSAGLELLGKLLREIPKEDKQALPAPGTIALCACDREADSPRLATLVGTLGGRAVDPLGRTHASSGLHHAVRTWATFLREDSPSFAEIRAALRVPMIIEGMAGAGTEEAYTLVNLALDSLDAKVRGGDLSQLIARADLKSELRSALTKLLARREEQRGTSPRKALQLTLRAMAGHRRLRKTNEADAYLLDVLDGLDEAAHAIQPGEEATLPHAEFFALTLELAGESRFRWSDGAEAVNLPGWLEAPWEPVPYLAIFGLNDHVVPRSRNADPFLPGSMRELLGLPSNDMSFAAAAVALEQIRHRRRTPGLGYDIIVPITDDNGDSLRPSRLLFLGAQEELPARVEKLFGESSAAEAEPYWEIPNEHKLDPSRPGGREGWPVDHLSASSIATYLGSPMEFWLQKALGLGKSTFGAVELDNAAFGTLVHLALQRWGDRQKGKTFDKKELDGESGRMAVSALESELRGELRVAIEELYGTTPPGTVLVQEQMAAARLARFAEDQVAFWRDGWVVHATEFKIDDIGLTAEGTKLEGRIDRIDHKVVTEPDGKLSHRWRLLDYKTGDGDESPAKSHIGAGAEKEAYPAPGDKQRWIGVQLPLYRRAWERKIENTPEAGEVAVGYIKLASSIAENVGATLDIWKELDDTMMKSAWTCIEKVAADIKAADAAHWGVGGEAEYPLLSALAKRPIQGWMDVAKLGEVRR